jgi:hypothetical protein
VPSAATSPSVTQGGAALPITTAAPVLPSTSFTSVYVSSSDGQRITITSVVFASNTALAASGSASSSTASATHTPTPFLKNKVLSGLVFTAVSIVGMIILVSIATMAMRKARKSKLDREEQEALENSINWPSPGSGAGTAETGNAAGPTGVRGSIEKAAWNDSSSTYGRATPAPYSEHGHGTSTPAPNTYQQPPSLQSHGGYYAQGSVDNYGYGVPPAGMQQVPNGYPVGYAPPHATGYPTDSVNGYVDNGAAYMPANSSPPQLASPSLPPALNVSIGASAQLHRTSLVNANIEPVSPTSSWEHNGSANEHMQRRQSHSRGLDPMLPPLPRSPALPESFGQRDSADKPLRVCASWRLFIMLIILY